MKNKKDMRWKKRIVAFLILISFIFGDIATVGSVFATNEYLYDEGQELPYIENVLEDGNSLEYDVGNMDDVFGSNGMFNISVIINVNWINDTPDKRPEKIKVQLLEQNKFRPFDFLDVEDGEYILTSDNLTVENRWELDTINSNLGLFGNCKLRIEPIEGYDIDNLEPEAEIEYVWDKSRSQCEFTISCTYDGPPAPETTTIAGEVVWRGDTETDRPDSLTIGLFVEGIDDILGKKDTDPNEDWQYKFENVELPEGKTEQDCRVKIINDPMPTEMEKYTAVPDGLKIYCTLNETPQPELVEVKGKVIWSGDTEDDETTRPENVTIGLFQGGTKIADTVIQNNGTDEWDYSFSSENISEMEPDKEYTVEITSELDGRYAISVEPNEAGYDIFCKFNPSDPEPELVEVKGEVFWYGDKGDEDQRPKYGMTIELYEKDNPEKYYLETAKSENEWKYTFANVEVPSGKTPKEIYNLRIYTEIVNYDVKIEDFDIHCTLKEQPEPEQITIEGTIEWYDGSNALGVRPQSVTLGLYRGEETTPIDSFDLEAPSSSFKWNYKFDNPVDKSNDTGEINYTVKIDSELPQGYTFGANPDADAGKYDLRCWYKAPTQEQIKISGNVVWWDSNHTEIRPAGVTLGLYKGEEEIDTVALSSVDNYIWPFAFENTVDALPEGESYTVKIKEGLPEYYTQRKYEEKGAGEYDILCKYDGHEELDVEGQIVWDDGNQTDKRPTDDVIVGLFEKGAAEDAKPIKTATTNATGNWVYTFEKVLIRNNKEVEDMYEARVVEPRPAEIDNYEEPIVEGLNIKYTLKEQPKPEQTIIEGTIEWYDGSNYYGQRPSDVTLGLYRGEEDTGIKTTAYQPVNGTFVWNYKFTEFVDKSDADGDIEYTVKIDSELPEGYTFGANPDADAGKYDLRCSYKPEETTITREIKWEDKGQTIEKDGEITLELVKKEQVSPQELSEPQVFSFPQVTSLQQTLSKNTYTATTSEADGWKYTFENALMPQGVEAEDFFELRIVDAPDWLENNYDVKIDGFNITCTLSTLPTKTIAGKIVWWDNNISRFRPSEVTLGLYRGEEEIDTVEVSSVNSYVWTYEFENEVALLPEGENYTVKVIDGLPEHYTQRAYEEADAGEYDVLCQIVSDYVNISEVITWDGGTEQDRPKEGVTVELYQEGAAEDAEPLATTVTDADNGWEYTFENVLVPKDTNVEVRTEELKNYKVVIDNFAITYIYQIQRIIGNIFWENEDNIDENRPNSITIGVYDKDAEQQKIDQFNIDDPGGSPRPSPWPYEITVDRFDETSGKEIEHVVKVEELNNYKSTYTATAEGFDITNTYNAVTTDFQVEINWDDESNLNKDRPASIKIALTKNDDLVGDTKVDVLENGTNTWHHTFENLPAIEDGETIAYGVEVLSDVPLYNLDPITYPTKTSSKITFKYAPETKIIEGKIVWWDDNISRFRPPAVTLYLYKEGEETPIETLVVKASKDGYEWPFKFETPVNVIDNAGDGIAYKVKIIEELPDYYGQKPFTEEGAGEYDILCQIKGQKPDIAGRITWDGDSGQENKRPSAIEVGLFEKGAPEDAKAIQTVIMNSGGFWEYTFENVLIPEGATPEDFFELRIMRDLDKLNEYYIEEINGFNITCTFKYDVETYTGEITWDGDIEQDRPDSVTVELFEEGAAEDAEPLATTVTDVVKGWKYTFENVLVPKDTNVEVRTDELEDYKVEIDGFAIKYIYQYLRIEGNIFWENEDNIDENRPTEILLGVYDKNASPQEMKVITIDETVETPRPNPWAYSIKVDRFNKSGEPIDYGVKVVGLERYTSTVDGYNITNTYNAAITNLLVEMEWKDKSNHDGKRPASVKIALTKNGDIVTDTEVDVPGNERDTWYHNFENLPKFEDNESIVYGVEILSEVKPYTVTTEYPNVTNCKITFNYTPETKIFKGKVIWEDENNQDGIRPHSEEYQIKILEAGSPNILGTMGVTVTNENEWAYNSTGFNLPAMKGGLPIEYQLVPVFTKSKEYETNIDYENDQITHTHVPEKLTNICEIVWDDGDNQDGYRPEVGKYSIEVFKGESTVPLNKIYAKEKEGDSNVWTCALAELNLPAKENGELVKYRLRPSDFANEKKYDTEIDHENYKITHTHKPEKLTIAGKIKWEDDNNTAKKRPDSVTVTLYKDDNYFNEVIAYAMEGNEWNYKFEQEVDAFSNGKQITYTVEGNDLSEQGYLHNSSDYDITYTRTAETVTISGEVHWNDGSNQDGKRPDSVILQIYKENLFPEADEKIQDIYVEEKDGDVWTYESKELPKHEQGEINYRVKVKEGQKFLEDYGKSEVNKTTVTFTRNPETIKIEGEKHWLDEKNQDGKRPPSIEVELCKRDGEVVISLGSVTVGPSGFKEEWKYSFGEKPVYEKGSKINYFVRDSVDGYESEAGEGFDLINRRVPEMTEEIKGRINWQDENNQDGIRPSKITVELCRENADNTVAVLGEKEVKPGQLEIWRFNFGQKPVYENGKEINYFVRVKTDPTGYTSKPGKVDYNLICTHIPEKIDISGQIIWEDENNNDGIRPNDVTVRLYGADKENHLYDVLVTESNNWEYTFKNLPKNSAGEPIKYSVKEVKVPDGYTASYETTPGGKLNIILHHELQKEGFKGKLTWFDGGNQDGLRPDSVQLDLYKKDLRQRNSQFKYVTTLDLIPSDKDLNVWEYELMEELVKEDGQDIEYQVRLQAPAGYTTTPGTRNNGYEVTASHDLSTKSITVYVNWRNEDGTLKDRPSSVSFVLWGKNKVGDVRNLGRHTIIPHHKNDTLWSYVIPDQDVNLEGEELQYYLENVSKVDGYKSSITELVITYEYISEKSTSGKFTLEGEKVWDDKGHTNKRPSGVTIELYRKDRSQRVDSIYLRGDSSDKWNFKFEGVPRRDEDDRIINYYLKEVNVPFGYESKVNGYKITNKYTGKATTGTHYAYIKGYPDNTVRPSGNLTRGETTAIIARLHAGGEGSITYNTNTRYKDVKSTDWYAKYINYMTANNLMDGYADGTFKPDTPITRAELANVINKYSGMGTGSSRFSDVSGHWAEDAIGQLYSRGLVKGYTDGSFQPDARITRAETVTMINRLLDRVPDASYLLPSMITWKDNSTSAWYYADIQEASNSHEFERMENNTEKWIRLIR